MAATDFGRVYQRACIESWRRAGFRVVSINSADEIQALAELNYPVEFVVSHRSRPSIVDFLQLIQESSEKIAGIINADCFLFDLPGALSAVQAQAEDGMVIIERLNLDPSTLRPSGELCYGFDAFFFATGAAQKIEIDDALCIGQPWWDYWLPTAFAAANMRLVSVDAPLLMHLDHDRNWQQDRWLDNGRRMLGWLLAADRSLPRKFEALLRDFRGKEVLSEEDISRFAQKCFRWVRSYAEPFPLVPEGGWEHLVLGMLRGAGGLPERQRQKEMSELTLYLAEARGKIFRLETDRKIHLSFMESSNAEVKALERRLQIATTQIDAMQAELDAVHKTMCRSLSRRIRRVLRRLFALLSRIATKAT